MLRCSGGAVIPVDHGKGLPECLRLRRIAAVENLAQRALGEVLNADGDKERRFPKSWRVRIWRLENSMEFLSLSFQFHGSITGDSISWLRDSWIYSFGT